MKNKHTGHAGVFSRRLRALTWVNIGIQACFPLAVAFTPTIAAAGGFLRDNGSKTVAKTQIYTLAAGETTASVARKFGISIAELRKMNQFRTFAHGFDHLQPGDELDVPAVRATGDASGKKTAAPHEDAQAVKVAGIASQAGSFLANNPNGEAAASIARGMAMGEATKEVQDWLGQFGTARVRLDADQHFSLKNSQLDLLVPVFDRDDTLVFTQGSLHRTDDRTQANLGAGVRWFNDGWMLGGNTFLDYDLSRQHTRLGIGVEYWRDFMKLGANSYLQLSNWKDSPDFSDYKERPANGWDIRAQGWLPALPQLGGKLTYEQYYGDEVGLFGKDHRQKDPHAFTAGIEYTPVPLVTLRAEQRQGKDGENDTRFGVDFRYQLGAPWQQQVDPGAVQAMRSLAGSRHDLVERNNNIVLEYRKKETIRLHAASLVTGYAGEKKSLGVSVNSTHGLDRIDWSAPALLAAGGKIVQDGPQAYSVVLPTYQYAPGINNYTVSGVAVDKKGNRSNTSETQVSVRAPEINKGNSTFTPLDSMLVADGKSTQHLTLSVRDAQGNAVDVPVSEISIDTGNLKSASVSSPVKKAIGEFEVTVTAGVDEEIVTLTPSVSGVKLDTARVAINKAFPSSVNSTFAASPKSIAADNTATSTLTFTAKDADGNLITTLNAGDVSFGITAAGGDASKVTLGAVTKVSDGVFTATLKGTLADTYTIVPAANGTPVSGLSDTVTLTAGTTPDAGEGNSTFAASPKSIAADNTATSTLTFTAKDANGNLITTLNAGDVSFGITAAGGDTSKVTLGAVTKVSDGVFTATLKGTLADTYTIVPAANGTPVSGLSDTVTLTAGTTPDAGEGNSTFAASPKSIVADNTATSTLTFTAKDANGNLITTLNAGDVSFGITAAGGDTSKVTLGTVTKVSDGVFTATLKGTLADTYTIVPAANGTPVSGLSDTVTLTAGTTPDAGEGNSTFAASPKSIAADNTATSTLTFTAKDANGNLITTLNAGDVSFGITAAGGDTSKVTLGAVTKVSDGVFTATLKGTLADTYTIVPAANGTPVSGLSDTVTLTAGTTPDAGEGNSTFAASPKSIAADDTATSTLTFTAKDANGNLITTLNAGDVSFGITAAGGDTSKVTLGTVTKVSDGVFTATLKGTLADTYTIVPAANGTPVSGLSDTVTLTAGTTPDAGEGNSTFAASPKSIAADNTATSTLTFTAKDANGNLITTLNAGDVSFGITAAGGDTSKVTLGAVTKVSDGVFTATLKGTLADTYTIVPAANGTPVSGLSDTVTLTAGTTPDAGEGNSTFAASPKSIVADNTATSTLTFTAKDANGNLITTLNAGDVSFGITAAGGDTSKVTLGTVTKVSDGVFTATLKGTLADTYTIVPAANGTPVSGLSDTVTLTAGTTPDAGEGNSTFAASPKSIVADDTATSTLTFTAKDANGNLITTLNAGDVSFGITAAGGDTSKVTLGAVTKVSDGVFTATLKGTLADTYTIVPAANGTPVSGLSDTVTLTAGTTPDAGEGNSTFAASPKSIAADNTATSTLTFTAKDANGNLITTLNAGDVSFGITAAGGDTSEVTLGTVTKVSDGVFTATLQGTLADTYTIVPAANGTPVSGLSDTVTLTAGTTPDAGEGNSTFAASPKSIAADNTATSTLTFTAKDANGNLITTLNAGDVSFGITAAGGDTSKVTLGAVTKVSDGVFTATLKGTLADTYTIVPAANGTPVSGLSDTVTLTAGTTPDAGEGNSTFAASPKSIAADDTATSTLTFTAKDANGNLITTLNAGDVSFGITAAGGDTSKVTLGAVTKVSDGVFTATLKGTLADTYTIVPAANGTPVSGLSDTVTLTAGTTPDAGEGNSTFAASPKSIAADNTATSTLTFTAKDANGNLITTLNAGDVSFGITAAGGDTSKVTLGAVTKVSDGVFTATLKGTLADTYTIVPAANGTPVSGLSDTVTLTAGTTPDAGEGNSTFAASPKSIAADDTATSTLTFTAKDANGNLITTLNAGDVSFGITAAGGDTSKVTLGTVTKVSDGVFTATLKGTLADTYTIVPAANGTPVSGLSDTVTLTAGTTPDAGEGNSTFAASPKSIAADDTATSTLTFTAKDANGNLITTLNAGDVSFGITAAGGDTSKVTLGTVTKVSDGVFTATLKGTLADTYTIVPAANGTPVSGLSDTVTLTAGTTPDAGEGNSTFAASPKSIAADNTATSTLTFTAKDANGNLITTLNAGDVSFGITAAGGDTSKVTLGAVTKVSDGVFTATLKGTLADTYTIVPAANGTPVSGLSDTVTLTAGTTPDAGEGNSTFAASPKSIVADNTATSTLTFTAKDANGNLITTLNAGDVSFGITAAGGDTSKVTLGTVTKVSDGVFTATLKGTLADTYTIVPAANGTPVSGLSDTVTLTAGTTPDAGEGNSTFAASPKSIVADDTATSTLTFTAKDANGNLITTLNAGDVSFGITAAGGDTSKVTLGAVTKVSDGVFTATLKGTLADTYTIVPAANGTPVSGLSDTVTLTAGTTPDAGEGNSTFAASPKSIVADDTATSTLTFTAKDANGNLITTLNAGDVSFGITAAGGDTSKVTLGAVTKVSDGVFTATLKGTLADTYTIVPAANGTPVSGLSDTVTLTVATAVQDILVNGYTYAVDAGFPKTGFAGAKFTVQLNGGEPTDYTWTSSASWASVSAGGEVTFTGKGDSTPVTVTATSKLDPTKAFEYTFTLNDWYINNGSTTMTWSAANTYCTNQGASLATRLQLGGPQLTTGQYNVRGTVGSLWSEWGDVSTYTGSGFPSGGLTWTSEVGSSGHHYYVDLTTGNVSDFYDSSSLYVACRQGL